MKKFVPGLLMGFALGAFAAWLLLARPQPASEATKTESAPAEPKSSGTGLHLSKEQSAAAGLQIAAPHVETLAPTVEAYGRVLDPAPLVAAAAEIATARAAQTASENEYVRVKSLHDEGDNASTQALETASAAAQRDRVQLDSARARFTASWGPALMSRLDSGLIAEAIARGWSFARIDLPPGGPPAKMPLLTARVALLTGNTEPAQLEIIGPAPTADPQLQGRGYLGLLRDEPLPAGAALRATLTGAGAPATFPVLPRSAFVRHEGSVFVFVQIGPDTFERRRVELGQLLPDGVAVISGVSEHDRVVVTGAQQLLSHELGGGGGGED